MRRNPLSLDIAPTQDRVEFTALIVGDTLPHNYEEAYARAKSEQVLSKKATAFKPPQIKRCHPPGAKGAPSGKRQRDSGQRPAGKDQQGSRHHVRPGKRSCQGKRTGQGKGKGQSKALPLDKSQTGS